MTKYFCAVFASWVAFLPATFAVTLAPHQVTATASQYSGSHIPANVVNRSGMVTSTTHNNTHTNMWLSQPDGNHAITFQFDDIYTLNQLRVWNYNQNGYTGRGIRHATIEYSRNGVLWSQLYGDYEIPQASGNATITSTAIDGRGVKARYVRLTPHALNGGSSAGNWGYTAQNHVGLSEVEFDVATSDVLIWNTSNMTVTADGQVHANYQPLYAVNGAGLGGASGLQHDEFPSQKTWLTTGLGASNPHPGTRPGKAWIKFAFNEVRKIRSMRVWNYGNTTTTTNGLRNVTIEYSPDNLSWTVLKTSDGQSNIHTFVKSSGADDYYNETLVNFMGREARYVIITAETTNGNWGGSGYGLAEVQFRTDPAVGMNAFCGVSDHIWVPEKEPVDSVPAAAAMFEWMSDTYGIRRMYWRDTNLWITDFTWDKESALQYDHHKWEENLYQNVPGYDTVGGDAAREYGMESWLYVGLFEAGVQPDVGIVDVGMFEDNLRVDNPDMVPLNRWGNRRHPGMLSFCYPEMREALIERYIDYMKAQGYDGINFYTYLENKGLRYEHEFGFEQAIIDDFHVTYPGVDLKAPGITGNHAVAWYKSQGKFVTQFLSEMKTALQNEGMKLSIILDPVSPNYAQPTWGDTIRATGNIYMDYQKWITDGLVDEIWVQLASVTQQKALLDTLLPLVASKPIKLVVRTTDPLGTTWNSYRAQGVTTIAVITWENNNGIEKYSLASTSASTLSSGDWKLRLQTLSDIKKGTLTGVSAASVAPLVNDRHPLVRRMAVKALEALVATGQVTTVVGALSDPEPGVRNAAAKALAVMPGSAAVTGILTALATDTSAPFKVLCAETLAQISSISTLATGLTYTAPAAREVCARALYKLGVPGGSAADQVVSALRGVVNNGAETDEVRYWALYGLFGLTSTLDSTERGAVLADCLAIIGDPGETPLVELEAAHVLEYLAPSLSDAQKTSAGTELTALFEQYGEGSTRDDAAYGWRMVGNALIELDRTQDLRKIMDPQVSGNLTATASSTSGNPAHTATKTINGSGLTGDKHNWTHTDMWLSGTGAGNWISYNFGAAYKLEKMQFWNYNQAGETDRGIRHAKIEYSLNGSSWTVLHADYEFAQASGTNTYLHTNDVWFNGITAQYVRITPLAVNGNWGDANANQVGVSEVIFNLDEEDASYPEEDYELSWLAYEALYEKQQRKTKVDGYNLVTEAQDILDHTRYAPGQ